MSKKTITEAIADLKVIDKRLQSQQGNVMTYLMRPEQLKDPMEKEGGSVEYIKRQRQSIGDLETQAIAIRRAIAAANDATQITVEGTTRTISEWLIWRREVAPKRQQFQRGLLQTIRNNRDQAIKKGSKVSTPDTAEQGDLVINIDEAALSSEVEMLDTILGVLDGQLSLKNATVTVEY